MSLLTTARSCALLFTAAAIFVLTACSPAETNVEKGNREGVLYWGNGTEPEDLDPHITTGIPEANIQKALFEPLVSSHPSTLEPAPGAAERWEISPDGTLYTFYLNPKAHWSNGDPVTAEDFVWSYWRGMHPKLGNKYVYMFYPIKNARAYLRKEIDDFDQVGVRALDKHTFQIELENPTPYFLGLLSHHSHYPVHRGAIEAHGDPWKRGSHWTRPGNMVTNGPFRLTGWKLFHSVTVEKNPHYHNADQIRLNKIHFLPTENITTEERMFRAGKLHFTNDLPIDKTAVYKSTAPEKLINQPYLGTYYYRLNVNKPPLNNPKVRRALAFAIDRQSLVDNVAKQGQTPAIAMTPPGTAGYSIESDIGYKPELARQLLAEAGFPNGEGIGELELLYNTSESHRKIAVAIQQMWKRELNISISLRNEDWKVYLNSQKLGNYQVSRAAWIGDYLDPNTFLDMWIKDGGNNQTGWYNEEYDRLVLEEAPRIKDPEERYAVLRRAESILLREMPVIPIYTYATKHLIHPSLKGHTTNLLDRPFFNYMYLDPDASEE